MPRFLRPSMAAVMLTAAACAHLGAQTTTVPPEAVVLGSSFTPPPPPFELEPTRHEMFRAPRPFAVGARLRFVSVSLDSHEKLVLERCDSRCHTAKAVGAWRREDFEKSAVQEIVIREAGDYALSLRHDSSNGEVGAVQAVAATFDRENGMLRFASGAVVFVSFDGVGADVDWPDDPPHHAAEMVTDGKSEVRKLESAAILEKARHGVSQELMVEMDPGEPANTLFRQSFPGAGEDVSRMDPATLSARQDAFAKYQAELLKAKQRMLASLHGTGVEMVQDFGSLPGLVLLVPSESALIALQAAPQVVSLSQNHRVVPT